jgi:hypothetical protein
MPFSHGDYYVKVFLISRGEPQQLTSPGMPQDEAEAAVEHLRQAQGTQEQVKLDWLTVYGNLVTSAHIQDQR